MAYIGSMTLAEFIKEHGSQRAAAEALGLSQGFVSKLLRRAKTLALADALRVQRDHGIDAMQLVSDDDVALFRSATVPAPAQPEAAQ